MMADRKRAARIGLVGAGFMGRCHANAFRSVGGIFDLPVAVELAHLADIDDAAAARNAQLLGFSRSSGDWRKITADPDVDIVAITAPNVFHEPIALDAIANGKAVYCEKPLSTTSESATVMADAAEAAGILTVVGFNFLSNPLITLTREIIEGGEIGDVTGFRGRHAEDYMASPDAPHSFRTDRQGGGALADLGSHIISLARYLVGPIIEVSADLKTIFPHRPIAAGSARTKPVEVDDLARALLRFENGASGEIEANWSATGRNMDLSFEVTGTLGSICFSQERMNELLVWTPDAGPGRNGYRRIEAGPDHPPYGRFCPAPGHHLGFNDLKVIEVARLLQSFADGSGGFPDFKEARDVQRTVDAAKKSSDTRRWVAL